jgi:hypothetical protein
VAPAFRWSAAIHNDRTTIDEFCSEHDVRSVDFIKVDTDGYDYYVLQGARRTDLEELTGVAVRRIHGDKGLAATTILTGSRSGSAARSAVSPKPSDREMRRRATIEPVIGHLKQSFDGFENLSLALDLFTLQFIRALRCGLPSTGEIEGFWGKVPLQRRGGAEGHATTAASIVPMRLSAVSTASKSSARKSSRGPPGTMGPLPTPMAAHAWVATARPT